MDGQNPSPSASPLLPNNKPNGVNDTTSEPKFLPNWDVAACNSPGDASHYLRRSKRRKQETFSGTLRSWIVNNQIGLAANLVVLLALAHISFPRARRRTRTFFELSYYHPSSDMYTQGPDDLFYVAFWIIIFTGLRASVMTYLLLPLAGRAGLKKLKTKVRFAEQAWLLVYYSVFWPVGVYIIYNSKYWFNPRELWTDFPARFMTGTLKWYYLAQFAFWIQQIVVVHIEEKRKDHWQMLTHHIVTCCLILFSYGYYQTKVGCAILCLMDVVDLALPVAKMLKYAGYNTLCDIAFGVFILTWVIARHVFYLMICWSIWVDIPTTMKYGCYSTVTGEQLSTDGGNDILKNVLQAYLDPEGSICFNSKIRNVFLGLLLGLQCITLLWFALICRVAYRVIKGQGAGDVRSDDEDEGSAEESENAKDDLLDQVHPAVSPASIEVPQQPLEEYVGVEGLNLKRRGSPRYGTRSKKSGTSTGLAFTGHSDRKEILGRIGCDKPT